MREGYVEVGGRRTWYGVVDGTGIPILLAHGGPGLTHDYLEPLVDDLAAIGRSVVVYDHHGGGRSDPQPDPAAYSLALLADELGSVIEAVGGRAHLYGHSYGGVVCLEFMVHAPRDGIVSLTIANSFGDARSLRAGWESLLSPDDLATVTRCEAAGTTEDPAYGDVMQRWWSTHVSTAPSYPALERSQQAHNGAIYEALHGPAWFTMTGETGSWTVIDRLPSIRCPTLVVCGKNDQCVPALSEAIARAIPGARLEVMHAIAHLPFVEARAAHLALLREHIEGAERMLAP